MSQSSAKTDQNVMN